MNIALFEDDAISRNQMNQFILKAVPDCDVSEYTTEEELLSGQKDLDLLFLQVRSDDHNGIELARKLRKINGCLPIVFLADSTDYVYDAFNVRAFQYLLKPVQESQLQNVLIRAEEYADRLEECRQARIVLKTKSTTYSVIKSEISYIESNLKKLLVHTKNECIEIYGSMKEMEDRLGTGFFRCHRGYLVDLAYVQSYSTDTIILTNGEQVLLSRERYRDFDLAYRNYLQKS
ncbi:MAG: response regulator transcription factor [Lachnospiraceae bacterium]|nr:response regulator transcription factor [Lachnospiraceae bacterium]